MRKLSLIAAIILLSKVAAYAQPSNDECANPIMLPNVSAFCSNIGAYTNVAATPSLYGPANCFGTTTQNDVWFSFVAEATDVNITIRGATAAGPGGTLKNPQVALYGGSCGGTLDELECQASTGTSHVAEAYQGGLFVGTTYLIRVQGGGGQVGTFQICINNYNPPVDPKSDCPQAAILCDKSPFAVQSVTGAGNNIGELNDASCFFNGQGTNFETNSTWFVWTCSVSGTLTFTLTPNNGPDDLDFVVYRLPNGIGNCSGKIVERCMASGQSDGINSAPCLGPTGLRVGDPDVSEDAGCSDNGDNAWLAPLNMVAGQTYALCVNNFSSFGNGFAVEFGGTGEFLGPDAMFQTVPSAVCLGVPVQVIDASTFPIGAITDWKWSFGTGSQPLTATGAGPHNVTFNSSGQHQVVLTVTTDLGCKVTHIQNVTIFPDVEVDTLIAVPDCNGGTNGAVEITNIVSGTPPYQFSWNGAPFTSNNTLTGLGVGVYNLVIRDANNCETELDIPVKELELTVAPIVTPPLCYSQDNGIITLNVTNGTGPFRFDWGSGLQEDNSQGGYSAGTYTIYAVDAELCKGTFVVTVTDHPPVKINMDTINVSCNGAANGVGIATGGGGVGNFTYVWSDGQMQAEAENLAPGTYSVTASDGNGCNITGSVSITEPTPLNLVLVRTLDLLCAGLPTGEIEVSASGGVMPYQYSPNGNQYGSSPVLTGLLAGNYWAKVRDANGCIDSVFAQINQPQPLTVIAFPVDTLLDLGYQIQTNTLTSPPGRPVVFEWTPPLGLSCLDCAEPLITGTESQLYIVKITDEDGCMDTDSVNIRVNKVRPIYFPNVFDPETGRYPNNFFTGFSGPAAVGMNLFRIFDRWGSLVFEGKDIPLNNPNQGWDGTINGKPAGTGVYTWYALVGFVDGVEGEYSGSITVIR